MKKILFPSPKNFAPIFVRQAAKLVMFWLCLLSAGYILAPATYAACACDSPLVTLQPTRYALPADGDEPTGVAVGDFNGDGKNDLLITNRNTANVSVMFGNGGGGFSPSATSIEVGSLPWAIVAGDFNGDGHLDFATTNQGGNSTNALALSIRYGDGAGGVAFGFDLPILNDPNNPGSTRLRGLHLAAIDFDHTGSPDLAIGTHGESPSTRVALFRNVGNTFLQAPFAHVTSAAAHTVDAVAVADFNRDGWDDMAVVRSGIFVTDLTNMFLLINNQAGGWNVTGFNVGPLVNLTSAAAADFDRDGDADLLVGANNFIDNSAFLALYLNNGSGVLTAGATSGFSHLSELTAADVNMDGFGDFVAARYHNQVSVLLGNRSAALSASTFPIATNQSPSGTGVGDFDGDGKPDLALPGAASNEVSVLLNTNNLDALRKTDYNGDGRTDFAVWRPGDSNWRVRYSYFGNSSTIPFGVSGDVPVPGDYDGDRKSDRAFYRPSTNEWYVLRSSNNSYFSIPLGLSGDHLVPGDYDGDCKTDIAMWRPSTAVWYIVRSSDSGYTFVTFGLSGDIPVPGDYDGDCKNDIAVFRPSTREWWIHQSSTNTAVVITWGLSGDKPVPGDYDGDGKTDIAVWRPSNGEWWLLQSTDGALGGQFGANGDMPQPGDYDGDGRTDVGFWRPSTGVWNILRSSDLQTVVQSWGTSLDLPVSAPYIIE